MQTYNLTTTLNQAITNIIADSKVSGEILTILRKYFRIKLDSYKYKFQSNINSESEFSINSMINLQGKNNTYIFYVFELPNVSIKFDVSNPFEGFQEQFESLLMLGSVFPQLKDLQSVFYRYYMFPNVNYGISNDQMNYTLDFEVNMRYTDIGLTIQFLRQLLTELQMETSSGQKKLPLPKDFMQISSLSDVNSIITETVDAVFSWIDTEFIHPFTGIRSLRIRDYQYTINIGNIFTIPVQGLTDLKFQYHGAIKYNNNVIPEKIKISMSFIPLHPMNLQNEFKVNG